MKRFAIVAASLAVVTACISPLIMLETEGALRRQVERVVGRHNAYVLADESLSDAAEAKALDESGYLLDLVTVMPEVDPIQLDRALDPVADRHDAYVYKDQSLDALDRDQFLATTAGLRAYVNAAMPPEYVAAQE